MNNLTLKFGLIVSLIAAFSSLLHGLPSTLRLGAIFDHSDHTQELAFKYAIRKINERKDLLPDTQLEYVTEKVTWDDSFHASKVLRCVSWISILTSSKGREILFSKLIFLNSVYCFRSMYRNRE